MYIAYNIDIQYFKYWTPVVLYNENIVFMKGIHLDKKKVIYGISWYKEEQEKAMMSRTGLVTIAVGSTRMLICFSFVIGNIMKGQSTISSTILKHDSMP